MYFYLKSLFIFYFSSIWTGMFQFMSGNLKGFHLNWEDLGYVWKIKRNDSTVFKLGEFFFFFVEPTLFDLHLSTCISERSYCNSLLHNFMRSVSTCLNQILCSCPIKWKKPISTFHIENKIINLYENKF